MASDESLQTLKVLLIGPSGAGKSALLTRYCDDQFDPETSAATIGIDFRIKKLSVRGTPYRLNIFDTAGQERFRTLSTSFYRGAQGVILVYDISNRTSFSSMERWFDEVDLNTVDGVALYLVGSKLDKAEASRAVLPEEGQVLAKQYGATFCEVSAKTRENVRRPFVEIVDQIVQSPELLALGKPQGSVAVRKGADGAQTGGCSC